MKKTAITVSAAAFWAAFSFPAGAQQVCTTRADLLKMLAEKYKEQPAGTGTVGTSSIVELFVSEAGTFTLLNTLPGGISCIFAAGKDWQFEAIKKGSHL